MIPVDLFGLPADHDAIAAGRRRLEDLFVLDDAAQAFGATLQGPQARHARAGRRRRASFRQSRSAATATAARSSPTTTSSRELIRSLRVHGQGADKYDNVRIGMTGRLDTIQAAVLIEKLKIFPDEIAARERVARRYTPALADVAIVPQRRQRITTSVWAQYTIRLAGRPARRARRLRSSAQGIPTAIYYPKPLHRQAAYRDFPVADGGLPVTERLAGEVISLPMHAYLDEPTQDRIIAAVRGRSGLRRLVPRHCREGVEVHGECQGCEGRGPPLAETSDRGTEQPMIERILTVGGLTLLSRVTGFARDIVLAAVLGAGPVADAFFVAFRLPNHFRAIFAEGAFNAAFVPAYARIRTQGGAGCGETVRRPHLHAAAGEPDRAAGARACVHAGGDRAAGAGLLARSGRASRSRSTLTRITFPYLLLMSLVTLYSRHSQSRLIASRRRRRRRSCSTSS